MTQKSLCAGFKCVCLASHFPLLLSGSQMALNHHLYDFLPVDPGAISLLLVMLIYVAFRLNSNIFWRIHPFLSSIHFHSFVLQILYPYYISSPVCLSRWLTQWEHWSQFKQAWDVFNNKQKIQFYSSPESQLAPLLDTFGLEARSSPSSVMIGAVQRKL